MLTAATDFTHNKLPTWCIALVWNPRMTQSLQDRNIFTTVPHLSHYKTDEFSALSFTIRLNNILHLILLINQLNAQILC